MLFLFRYFLVIILGISISTVVYAENLLPPQLGEVMKENENIQKSIFRQQRILNNRKKITNNVLSMSGEILSYHTIKKGASITISRYDTIDLWVQDIQLDTWWRLDSILTLGWYDESSGEPLFEKKKLSEIKNALPNQPFSILNGQFFDPKKSNTPLSFWLKVNGIVRTAWADNRNEPKNILILEKNKARIIPYSWENLRDAPGYFAMVNLSLEKPHYRDENIGRTYMCLRNPNSNNESSNLLIFTAVSMTEPIIEKELIRWGCTLPLSTKLDSSGSTRLWVNGEYIYGNSHNGTPDYRWIPHSIVVYDWTPS